MVFLELSRKALGSSVFATGNSGNHSVASGKSGLFLCCEGQLGIPFESLQWNRAPARVET